jgi:hypothetical protein
MSYFVPGIIDTSPLTVSPIYPYGRYGSYPLSPYTTEVSVSVSADGYPTKTERVLVPSLPNYNYYSPSSLYYADPLIYSYPTYQTVSYLDINADKDLHKKVTKNFYSKLYNKWIPEIYPNLLNYLKISGNDVSLVKSLNEAKNNTTKDGDFGKKINYLATEILTKVDLYELLLAYSNNKGVKWWNMRQYCEDIELYIIKKLEQKLRELIL